jgi:hypothetical protein
MSIDNIKDFFAILFKKDKKKNQDLRGLSIRDRSKDMLPFIKKNK